MTQKIGVIVLARMNSSRLPGKTLTNIGNKPLLLHVTNHLSYLKKPLVIATSDLKSDDPIVDFCVKNNFAYFRGPESDVVLRMKLAADHHGFHTVVRATADNPLIDTDLAQLLINFHMDLSSDYTFASGYPTGTAVEVFSYSALSKLVARAKNNEDREHPGLYILKHQDEFTLYRHIAPIEVYYPQIRVTVDTKEDLMTVRNVVNHLRNQKKTIQSIIKLYQNNNHIFLNTKIKQYYPTEKIRHLFTKMK